MLLFTRRVEHSDNDTAPLAGVVSLPFELRQRSRLRIEVSRGALAGTVVGFDLPRGSVLRSGDRVRCAGGELIRIDAAAESLAHIAVASAAALTRIAYHLGNRHVPVEVGDGWLRLQADPVLERMVLGLGATPTHVEAPFEPEAGAYGHAGHGHSHAGVAGDADAHEHEHARGHGHSHDRPHGADGRHAPRIHDLLADRPPR